MGATGSTERRTRGVVLEPVPGAPAAALRGEPLSPGKTLLQSASPVKAARSPSERVTTPGSAEFLGSEATSGGCTTRASQSREASGTSFGFQGGSPERPAREAAEAPRRETPVLPLPRRTVSQPARLAGGAVLLPIKARRAEPAEDVTVQPRKAPSVLLPIAPRRSICCGAGRVSSPVAKDSQGAGRGGGSSCTEEPECLVQAACVTPTVRKSTSAPLLLPVRSRRELAGLSDGSASASSRQTCGAPTPWSADAAESSQLAPEVRSPSTAASKTRRKARRCVTFGEEQCVHFKVEDDSTPEDARSACTA